MANLTSNPNIPTQIVKDVKFPQFCANLGIIPSGYRDSMTYYEIVAWLCKFLEETVIPTVNENGNSVQELQELYVQLNDYVSNYFENLDVQDEINHKLDEMAENGVLQTLLFNYTKLIKVYDTFNDLKADQETLLNGMQVQTLGYNTINDGGGATYKITTQLDAQNFWQETLVNQAKYANLIIINNTINFKQIGGTPQTETEKTDNKEILQKFLNWIKLQNKLYKLYIPTGIWAFSEVVFPQILNGFVIYGDEALNLDYSIAGTIITAYTANQNSVWSIGKTDVTGCKSFTLKNLNFSSGDYDVATYKAPHLLKVKTALNIINSSFGILDNIGFINVWGSALTIASTWEMYYKLLFFRHIDAQNDPGILVFDNLSQLHANDYAGVNASAFDNVMFEAFHGTPIKIKSNSNFGNSSFKNINLEDFKYQNPDNEVLYHSITENLLSYRGNPEFVVNSIIECEDNTSMLPLYIGNLELNNVAYRYYTDFTTQKNYIIDTILHLGNNYHGNITFGNINCQGIAKDLILMSNYPENLPGKNVFIDFNYVTILGKAPTAQGVYELKSFPLFNYAKGKLLPNYSNTNVFARQNQYNNTFKAIDFVYKKMDNEKGFIYTDLDASNDTKLVIKPVPNAVASGENQYMVFRKLGNTLYMNAKIPKDQEFRIVINDLATNYWKNWVGTGQYQIYSIDITNANPEAVLRAITVPDNMAQDISIDYFYFN